MADVEREDEEMIEDGEDVHQKSSGSKRSAGEAELPVDESVGIPLKRPDEVAAATTATATTEAAPAASSSFSGDRRGEGPSCCYLILFNLNKKNNLGLILRSAAAFGVRRIVLVGREGFKSFCKKSGQGAVPIQHAATLPEAISFLRGLHSDIKICGVEILPEAASLHQMPFSGATAFMVGNERGGLTREQIQACDTFVYIPQFGGGVGSLNVACACSVVLYQFTVWASQPKNGGLGVDEDVCPEMTKLHGAGSFPLKGTTA
mmetsp:Transcript_68381/g.142950  ORF Transcript_68381/g.142950 Transcript_68381/m.142950 type:complete len:262 (+) Transcript_68381:163-948(+)